PWYFRLAERVALLGHSAARIGLAVVAVERLVLDQLARLRLVGGSEHFLALHLRDLVRRELHGHVARARGPCCDTRGRRDQDRERETDGSIHRQTSLVGPRGRTRARIAAGLPSGSPRPGEGPSMERGATSRDPTRSVHRN